MLNFAANVSYIFTEFDIADRFKAAARNGFSAVEFLFPYEFEQNWFIDQLGANDLRLILMNLPSGNWDQGERGIACLPDRVAEFRDGVGLAVDYAKALGCPMINCIAGRRAPGFSEESMRQTLVENLRFAAKALSESGIRLVVEPLNAWDHPGLFLTNTKETISVLDEADADIGYQYDFYHMQRMEGDLAETIRRHIDRIAYIQIADSPDRHEPGTGEVNFHFMLPYIESLGYDGWIGCEYRPLAGTEEGLAWIDRFGHRRTPKTASLTPVG